MASTTPLSYQTTMPEYPDVSYQAWVNKYNLGNSFKIQGNGYDADFGRFGHSIAAWANGYPSYETWRTNMLDEYNAALSAYNTWLSSGAGIRASAESGEYNPSYFQAGSSNASPLNYQDVSAGSGFSEMAQGVSGIINFVMALQGLRMKSAQLRGIDLANEKLAIENKYLPDLLSNKRTKGFLSNDALELLNTVELASRFGDLGTDMISPSGKHTYNLSGVSKGLQYQTAVQDLSLVKATGVLRKAQSDMMNWSEKEKKFYVENMQQIEKDILNGKLSYINGQVDFQQMEQDLRKNGANANIATKIIDTILGVVKILL